MLKKWRFFGGRQILKLGVKYEPRLNSPSLKYASVVPGHGPLNHNWKASHKLMPQKKTIPVFSIFLTHLQRMSKIEIIKGALDIYYEN